jgi:PDZ domain-containing protein
MRRQATALLVSSLSALLLVIISLYLPAPYVRRLPGPVTDTLGSAAGKQLITIAHSTATTDGKIYLVTVDEIGGPRKSISAFDVLHGWWSKSEAIIPRRLLYSEAVTPQQVAQQDTADMISSQDQAKIAALKFAGFPLKPGVEIASVILPALKGKLDPDDIIVGIDSAPVTDTDALSKATKAHQPGDQITLNIVRGAKTLDVPVTLQKPSGTVTGPTIGISVYDSFTQPFAIGINLANVGGPSAGTAFALGIVDKLTDGNLTGGKTIAVTGTIDADGNVGPIGGVVQKMAGAKAAGATIFMLPKDNCSEALTGVPHGLRLIPITTLASAVSALKAVRDGGTSVPACPASK